MSKNGDHLLNMKDNWCIHSYILSPLNDGMRSRKTREKGFIVFGVLNVNLCLTGRVFFLFLASKKALWSIQKVPGGVLGKSSDASAGWEDQSEEEGPQSPWYSPVQQTAYYRNGPVFNHIGCAFSPLRACTGDNPCCKIDDTGD